MNFSVLQLAKPAFFYHTVLRHARDQTLILSIEYKGVARIFDWEGPCIRRCETAADVWPNAMYWQLRDSGLYMAKSPLKS